METKKCRYCGKEVVSLANHIVRMHPAVLEQIEEISPPSPPNPPNPPIVSPVSQNLPAQNTKTGDISSMIRDKLDIMLNIKIIEMLSSSKDLNLVDLQKAINPPQKTTIEEIKEYHELVYGKDLPHIDTGNQWLDIAQQAVPIIKEMLPRRKNNLQEVDSDVRGNQEGNTGILKPIFEETPGSPGEPKNTL